MAGYPLAVEASSKHQSIADSVPDGPVLRITSLQQTILIRAGWMSFFCLAVLGSRQAGFHSVTTSSMHPPFISYPKAVTCLEDQLFCIIRQLPLISVVLRAHTTFFLEFEHMPVHVAAAMPSRIRLAGRPPLPRH